MRDFRDAKAMAQTLREGLKPKSISLTHSECLELVAKMLGFHDWNVLSAHIQANSEKDSPRIPIGADLPIVPIRDIVLFPNLGTPLFVGRDSTKRALECAMAGDRRVLAVTQRRAGDDDPDPGALYGVGVIATVMDLMSLGDGTIKLFVKTLKRAAIVGFVRGQFLTAQATSMEDVRGDADEAFALARAVLEKLAAHRDEDFLTSPHARLSLIREPGVLADAVAPHLAARIEQKQELLETGDVVSRLEKILALINAVRQPA
jgi:ATP-dependent Lon protease